MPSLSKAGAKVITFFIRSKFLSNYFQKIFRLQIRTAYGTRMIFSIESEDKIRTFFLYSQIFSQLFYKK